jgi:hypothetical protein
VTGAQEAGGGGGGKKGWGVGPPDFPDLEDSRDQRIGNWDDSIDVEVKALFDQNPGEIQIFLLSLEPEEPGGGIFGD